MQRIFAHIIRYAGRDYTDHIIELDPATGSVALYPYREEIPSTVRRDNPVEVSVVCDSKSGRYTLSERRLTESEPIPVKLTAPLKSVLWGGDRIAALKNIERTARPVGESWEVSGIEGQESTVDGGPYDGMKLSELIERFGASLVGHEIYERFGREFPILVKFLDARRDLSLQVHPDDELAGELYGTLGKAEMWYVLHAEPGAKIYAGFKDGMTPEEYDSRVADDSIMDCVEAYDSRPGDVFYLPAGRVHCLGAGNMVVEVQETCDINYRISDFGRLGADGRPRELHIERARQAIDFASAERGPVRPERREDGVDMLLKTPYFEVGRLEIAGQETLRLPEDNFVTVTCIEGTVDITDDRRHKLTLGRGRTAFIPAVTGSVSFDGAGTLILATRRR